MWKPHTIKLLVASLTLVAGAVAAAAQTPISASEAPGYVGAGPVEICGWVAGAKHADTADGKPTFLDIGQPYPLQDVTIVIWEEDRKKFSTPPEDQYLRQHVCAMGVVKRYGRGLQLVVRGPADIRIGLACHCAAADTIISSTDRFVHDLPEKLAPFCISNLKHSLEAIDHNDKGYRRRCRLALRELQAHIPPDPDKHQWSVSVEGGAQGSTFNTDGSVAITGDDTGLFDSNEPFVGFTGQIDAIARRTLHLDWTVRFGSVDIELEDAQAIGMAGETILDDAETLYLRLEGYRTFGPHYSLGIRASGYSPTKGSDEVPSEFRGEHAVFGRVTNQHWNLLRGSYLELGYVHSERFIKEDRAFAAARITAATGKKTGLFAEFAATVGSGSDDLRVAIGIQHELLTGTGKAQE